MKFYKWIFFCFMLVDQTVYSQWGPHCIFDLSYSIPTWSTTGNFGDADFISKDTGVYSFSYQCSPSVMNPCYAITMKNTWDGGNTWANSLSGGAQTSLRPYANRKQKTIYAVRNTLINPYTKSTTLYKTSDGGTSWSTIYSSGDRLMSLPTGPDSSHLFFFTTLPSGFTTEFLCKYENGILEDSLLNVSSLGPVDLFFPDQSIGYMTATTTSKTSLVLKSINGGLIWDTVYYNPLRSIGKLFFVDTANGFALCDSGKIIKTVNGGNAWQEINTGQSTKLNSLFFHDQNFGLMAGDSGLIIRSIDGGITWTKDSTGTKKSFQKIFVVNDTFGCAIYNSGMYRANIFLSGIWEPTGESEIIIPYPNPSKGIFSITTPAALVNSKNAFYKVFDSYGRMAKFEKIVGGTVAVDLSSYAKGLYMIHISDCNLLFYCKTVIE